MARGVDAVLLLDELLIAGRLLEGGEARRSRSPGRPILHASATGSCERGGTAEQSTEEERAKPLAAFGIHETILSGPPGEPLGSVPCSARWAISSST